MVLIDFWTYTCINCIRTLPYVESWDSDYRKDGLVVVGVHSPEFPFEKDAGNVADAIQRDGIHYPVVQDNDLGTWNAFGNQYWPAKYLIDSKGRDPLRPLRRGRLRARPRTAIRSLLAEAGLRAARRPGARPTTCERPDPMLRTPETYLGAARAQGWINGPQPGGTGLRRRSHADSLQPNQFAYGGAWDIGDEAATAEHGASVALRLPGAARLPGARLARTGRARCRCCSTASRSRRPIAGDDVHGGVATISDQRLYRLVDLPRAGHHTLELRFEPGIEGYAFTFG